jgi:hypothetical protein
MRDVRKMIGAGAIAVSMAAPAWALDCTRIKAMTDEGLRPSEIAQALGITTPEVQACLAGAIPSEDEGEDQMQQRVPRDLPGSVDELRRPPNS